MYLPPFFGKPIDTPSGHRWAGPMDARIRIEGHANYLYGATGTVIGRSEQPDAWLVRMDAIPDGRMPGHLKGSVLVVSGRALVVTA